jgi:hypothetical protein
MFFGNHVVIFGNCMTDGCLALWFLTFHGDGNPDRIIFSYELE